MASNISQLLKQTRLNAHLSQKETGQLLGISQGMVSQIEGGTQTPSREVAEKIRLLAEKHQPAPKPQEKVIEVKRHLRNWKHEPFEFSLLEVPYENQSADLFIEEKVGGKLLALMGDAFGHGDAASHMAKAISFGFRCIQKTINSEALVPSNLIYILKSAYHTSGTWWAGPPAMMAFQLDLSTGDLDISNDGMPSLLFFNKEGEQVRADQTRVTIPPGGSVLIFSDGFVDLFDDPIKMQERFLKMSKSFRGDAQAIMLNLLKASRIGTDGSTRLRDDVTAVVITRSRSLA